MRGAEFKRLAEDTARTAYWKKWGPYLSMRQWGTVREDVSEHGDVWTSFPFDHADSRAYQWGEDGIGGISDSHQRLCFSFAFWNEQDPRLKERLFGLSNVQGNHGEDVKELYYFLDNTPTHSYMSCLYKYPQAAFPYERLVQENRERSQKEREFEILDTGIFNENKYFDCFIEYAKEDPDDIWIRLKIINRGPQTAPLHILAKLWARNLWRAREEYKIPVLRLAEHEHIHCDLGGGEVYRLYAQGSDAALFTDNETNEKKLYHKPSNHSPYTKDGLHEYLVHGNQGAVNPAHLGTIAAFHFKRLLDPGQEQHILLRLVHNKTLHKPFKIKKDLFRKRAQEADDFYKNFIPSSLGKDEQNIQRQAFAGMLWNKQYYSYVVDDWLKMAKRQNPRNNDWRHLYSEDIISTPDNWEYPAFFSWDTAFHMIVLAMLDPSFAKTQLLLFTREWYMHPNGQIPAYEWNFDDVNPPVHAWAAWRTYKIEAKYYGRSDRYFLESIFQKLLLNFTWWINREDWAERNIFKGGFLGLDNISVFNRSADLPKGWDLYQSDATSWMGMYCLNMLTIAFELAKKNRAYEDMASKFYEHFLYISKAINCSDDAQLTLWDEQDGFYYDILSLPDGSKQHLKVKSLVGLMPLMAVATIDADLLQQLPGFFKRMQWFIKNRDDICSKMACMKTQGVKDRRILSILSPQRLQRLLCIMLNEDEFLSPYGIRSLSKVHGDKPFVLHIDGKDFRVDYEPAESTNRLFGGNSNWRGPVWLPINLLIIESLQKYHHYYGEEFKIEFPTGSSHMLSLWDVSMELSKRLVRLFKKDEKGCRPCFGSKEKLQSDIHFHPYLFFNEYFHGETGEGLGASHQTGWTGVIAKLIHQVGIYSR